MEAEVDAGGTIVVQAIGEHTIGPGSPKRAHRGDGSSLTAGLVSPPASMARFSCRVVH
ncbi:MAG: hypothetical protein VCF24_16490 [Candidatus Latescibacterota bacterium]